MPTVREDYIVKIPLEWKKNKEAGLCPVCGKTTEEFGKGRRVYCSEKCASDFANCFITWNSLRDKLIAKTPYCEECGITEEKWDKQEAERINILTSDLFEKYRTEIWHWKMKKIGNAEQYLVNEIKRIEDLDLDDWSLKTFVEKIHGKIDGFPDSFPGFEVDHILAIVNGGDMWNEKNLQVLCRKPCHVNKTKKDIKKSKELE